MRRHLSFCAGIDGEASRCCAGGGRTLLYKLARASAAPTRHCPHPTTATYTRRASASAMKMPSWPRKTKHDHEASSSRGVRQIGRTPSPLSPTSRSRAFLRQLPPTPGQRITWGEGRPSMHSHRGSKIGATCATRSARRSGRRTRASTTPTSPSPTAGTSTVPGCQFHRCRGWCRG
jgi:hypothetical protein